MIVKVHTDSAWELNKTPLVNYSTSASAQRNQPVIFYLDSQLGLILMRSTSYDNKQFPDGFATRVSSIS